MTDSFDPIQLDTSQALSVTGVLQPTSGGTGREDGKATGGVVRRMQLAESSASPYGTLVALYDGTVKVTTTTGQTDVIVLRGAEATALDTTGRISIDQRHAARLDPRQGGTPPASGLDGVVEARLGDARQRHRGGGTVSHELSSCDHRISHGTFPFNGCLVGQRVVAAWSFDPWIRVSPGVYHSCRRRWP